MQNRVVVLRYKCWWSAWWFSFLTKWNFILFTVNLKYVLQESLRLWHVYNKGIYAFTEALLNQANVERLLQIHKTSKIGFRANAQNINSLVNMLSKSPDLFVNTVRLWRFDTFALCVVKKGLYLRRFWKCFFLELYFYCKVLKLIWLFCLSPHVVVMEELCYQNEMWLDIHTRPPLA